MSAGIGRKGGTRISPLEVVEDEIAMLRSLVRLRLASILELGCGNGALARRLVETTDVASIAALEVDRVQHRLNVEGRQHPRITFAWGPAEDIPFPDASFDGVLMMKSLHHVPVDAMDRALHEVARVLKPGGWLYVAEPVYTGELNEIIRLFHDEGAVRAAAYEALQRAGHGGVLVPVAEKGYATPVHYKDYDDFVARQVRPTHSKIDYPDAVAAEVRARLARFMTSQGASFARPMRVNVFRRAGD